MKARPETPRRSRRRRGLLWLLCGLGLCSWPACTSAPPGQCQSSTDCTGNQICVLGQCQRPGEHRCEGEQRCPQTHYCHEGLCIANGNPPRCEKDSHCIRYYRCNEGRCTRPCQALPEAQQQKLGQLCTLARSTCKGIGICNDKDQLECLVDKASASKEICDDKDNDCDGQIDEGFPDKGQRCIIGTGACRREDVKVCNADGSGLRCGPEDGLPTQELCDDKDNDCDGQIDEDFSDKGKACISKGTGGCQNPGVYTCKPDGSALFCDPPAGAPEPEVCDGKDNDCDGTIDEGSSDCVGTFAGSKTIGFLDGPAKSAQFSRPKGLAFDKEGNLYVADTGNYRIRKIDTKGNVTTFAGSGTRGTKDGPATSAQFSAPHGLAFDTAGHLYVSDLSSIRKIDTKGNVSTFVAKQFSYPQGLVFDKEGNLYVADSRNHRIHKIDNAGAVTLVAGDGKSGSTDGPGAQARLNHPNGLVFDEEGNLYVAGGNNVRKIDKTGQVTTPIKDTQSNETVVFYTETLLWGAGGRLYISGDKGRRIWRWTKGSISLYIPGGSGKQFDPADGPVRVARFADQGIGGLALGPDGYIYITDATAIRRVLPQ